MIKDDSRHRLKFRHGCPWPALVTNWLNIFTPVGVKAPIVETIWSRIIDDLPFHVTGIKKIKIPSAL